MNIELLVVPEAKPRWDVFIDTKQRPTLTPSVWVQRDCRSHFHQTLDSIAFYWQATRPTSELIFLLIRAASSLVMSE
jgi:hypothetical protein